jgi:hypothetical protein
MARVLAIGPKVGGFSPGRGRCIFEGEKIRSTPSFRGNSRRPYVLRFYRMLKIPSKYEKRYFVLDMEIHFGRPL